MSINIKKYTKDQMAKMVEDAQAEVQKLKRVNAASKLLNNQGQQYWRAWQASKREVADLENKLNDTEAALGRANAELGAAEGAVE